MCPDNLCFEWDVGDEAATNAAFANAAHVARISLVNNRLVGNPMEPRAAIGEYDPATGQYTLWTTSQFPHIVKVLMGVFVLKIPQHKLRVVAPDVGGGFGVKQFHYPEETLVTWASRKLGRPVKWVCDRSEGFISDAHGRDHVTEAELALDENGKFLGAAGRDRSPTWAAISRRSGRTSRPISTVCCLPASTRRRRSIAW